jgi:outer membrane protein assembly factor BamB
VGVDGKPLWRIEGPFGGNIHGRAMSVAVSPSGTVYACDGEGGLYVHSALGAQFRTAIGLRFSGPPVFAPDGAVLVGSSKGLCAIVNGSRGPEATTRSPFDDKSSSAPAVGPDGTLYFYYGPRLLAVDPFGGIKWAARMIEPRPLVDQMGTVYGRTDKGLMAVAADGRLLWEFRVESRLTELTAGPDDTHYAGDPQGNLYAVSREGRELWVLRLSTNRPIDNVAGPVDGVLYASTREGITAVSVDGRVLWHYSPSRLGTFSVAIQPGGPLFVTADAALVALSVDPGPTT